MVALRKFIAAIEPWYHWGPHGGASLKDERGGDGGFFMFEWLGLQILFAFTRFPKEK